MAVSTGTAREQVSRAHLAALASFTLNGFAVATWASRIPSVRHALDLDPGRLGLLLLFVSLGAVVALPTSGATVQRFGTRRVVTGGALMMGAGMLLVAVGVGVLTSLPTTMLGLAMIGYGTGSWDVAMNVEAATVERHLGRAVMPRFHAAFSLGTVGGATLGSVVTLADLGITAHLAVVAVLTAVGGGLTARGFLPVEPSGDRPPPSHAFRAWTEPRTLVIGVMVLAMALTEGVANDWLGVAVIDGYGAAAWLGSAAFALFVTAMTVGRLVGSWLLDAFGRLPVLWGSMAVAGGGVLLVVLGHLPAVVCVGIVAWGLGASLGFPVGISAAADDPDKAAGRVGVVSTIGYTAFLGGPPLVGWLGDHVGVLHALLVVSVILVPSTLAVPAARPAPQQPPG